MEETGLELSRVRVGTVMNVVDEATAYHYIVIFMVGDALPGATPANLEPDKCAGWEWRRWADDAAFPSPLFKTLAEARNLGFDPFDGGSGGGVLHDAKGDLPPYCCCILHEAKTGALLVWFCAVARAIKMAGRFA